MERIGKLCKSATKRWKRQQKENDNGCVQAFQQKGNPEWLIIM